MYQLENLGFRGFGLTIKDTLPKVQQQEEIIQTKTKKISGRRKQRVVQTTKTPNGKVVQSVVVNVNTGQQKAPKQQKIQTINRGGFRGSSNINTQQQLNEKILDIVKEQTKQIRGLTSKMSYTYGTLQTPQIIPQSNQQSAMNQQQSTMNTATMKTAQSQSTMKTAQPQSTMNTATMKTASSRITTPSSKVKPTTSMNTVSMNTVQSRIPTPSSKVKPTTSMNTVSMNTVQSRITPPPPSKVQVVPTKLPLPISSSQSSNDQQSPPKTKQSKGKTKQVVQQQQSHIQQVGGKKTLILGASSKNQEQTPSEIAQGLLRTPDLFQQMLQQQQQQQSHIQEQLVGNIVDEEMDDDLEQQRIYEQQRRQDIEDSVLGAEMRKDKWLGR